MSGTSVGALRADQNRFVDCPIRLQANRLKKFSPVNGTGNIRSST